MNTYLVTVSILLPYPKEYEFRITCTTGFGTAANRAYQLLRKEESIKGRKLKQISFKIIKV